MIPYGKQYIDDDDIKAVVKVLKSERIAQGPTVEEFEYELQKVTGAKHAVAVNSGTSALHIACLCAGIKEGDEVITSPITFVASANCVVYCGGTPIFADIDPKTYNISHVDLGKKINKNTKAIIPVHFAGQSCDMEVIQQIVRNAEEKYGHKIHIIEDACHALGSIYKGNKVGSCVYSDMTVMSFHPVKHITTGEGGVVFTNDKFLDIELKRFRSHGITNDPKEFKYEKLAYVSVDKKSTKLNEPNPWYYEQLTLGYNYRINNIQCALGLSQLRKLNKFSKRRKDIVKKYNTAFFDSKILQVPFEDRNCDSNFHLYVLQFDLNEMGMDRAQLMLLLKNKGVNTQVHYIPVYMQPYYQKKFGTGAGDCPKAEDYYKNCLSIPLFPAMTDIDVENVIAAVNFASCRNRM